MNNDSREIPPLASPHGGDTTARAPHLNENHAHIGVHLQLAADWRYVKLQLTHPASFAMFIVVPLISALLLLPLQYQRFGFVALPLSALAVFVGFLLLVLPPTCLIQMSSQRHFEVWISKSGLTRRYPKRDMFFRWSKFVGLIERDGDVWLISPADGCFIPRECFTSPDEAREFAQIARELKSGGAWRDEWNGRTFGVLPPD